jgi:Transposase DDE domain
LALVLGWLQHPLAGPSQLARFAFTAGVRVSKQAIAQRLTEQTAQWLRGLLAYAVSTVLCASTQAQGVLARFPAVILEDASSVQLPNALAFLWKGHGGSGSASSVKLAVRWDMRSGQLQGPILQDGKSHETHNTVHTLALPRGGVWIADAGYDSLLFLRQLSQLGVFFVIRPRGNLAVATLDGQRLSLATSLKQQTGKIMDVSVRLGSIPALWLPARLLALPVAPQVAEQRRAHLLEKAKNQGHVPSAEALALADWNLLVTNLPASFLQAQEVLLLYRARGKWSYCANSGKVMDRWTNGAVPTLNTSYVNSTPNC